jgi:hypothetical protein
MLTKILNCVGPELEGLKLEDGSTRVYASIGVTRCLVTSWPVCDKYLMISGLNLFAPPIILQARWPRLRINAQTVRANHTSQNSAKARVCICLGKMSLTNTSLERPKLHWPKLTREAPSLHF